MGEGGRGCPSGSAGLEHARPLCCAFGRLAAISGDDGVRAMKRFAYTIFSCIALIACTGAASERGEGGGPEVQAEAEILEADFLDSLGVNVHLNYTDGAYARLDRVAEDMRYLGLAHVRTHDGGDVVDLDSYARLAQGGLRYNLIATYDRIDETVDFAARLMSRVPGSVASIEGFNEINNWPVVYRGMTGEDAARAAQVELYAKAKARAELADVPVLYFTGGQKTDDITNMADAANFHAYSNNALQPRQFLQRAMSEYGGAAARLPRMNTEFGNFTLPEGWPKRKPYWANYTQLGVDEATQAKIVLNAYFEGVQLGIARSYVYELLDQKPDPRGAEPEFHFGLFTFEHRPKASARALHQMTRFLERTRSNSALGEVEAKLETTGDMIGKVAIRRVDGSLIVALWNRTEFWRWDQYSSEPTNAAPMATSFRALSGSGQISASVFDPLDNTVRDVKVDDQGGVALTVPDYPVFIWLRVREPAP